MKEQLYVTNFKTIKMRALLIFTLSGRQIDSIEVGYLQLLGKLEMHIGADRFTEIFSVPEGIHILLIITILIIIIGAQVSFICQYIFKLESRIVQLQKILAIFIEQGK